MEKILVAAIEVGGGAIPSEASLVFVGGMTIDGKFHFRFWMPWLQWRVLKVSLVDGSGILF